MKEQEEKEISEKEDESELFKQIINNKNVNSNEAFNISNNYINTYNNKKYDNNDLRIISIRNKIFNNNNENKKVIKIRGSKSNYKSKINNKK